MALKICFKCKLEKELLCFSKNTKRKDGLYIWCKQCSDIAIKKYRLNNKEKLSEYGRRYRKGNQERIAKYQKEYDKKYRKCRLLYDINYKISSYLRRRLNVALKGNAKSGSAIKDLGCSIAELKKHLESKFQNGMSWQNYGKWHIDHIKPLRNFNLTSSVEVAIVCHYTNLQPLWAKDNLSKGSK